MRADIDAQGNLTIAAESGVESYALLKWFEVIMKNMKKQRVGSETINIEITTVIAGNVSA